MLYDIENRHADRKTIAPLVGSRLPDDGVVSTIMGQHEQLLCPMAVAGNTPRHQSNLLTTDTRYIKK